MSALAITLTSVGLALGFGGILTGLFMIAKMKDIEPAILKTVDAIRVNGEKTLAAIKANGEETRQTIADVHKSIKQELG